jgi:molecular chaperone HscB
LKLSDDDFTLFGLPQRFAIERTAIDARWRALQAEVHPDRHATQGPAAQRVAAQWSMRINEAHRRLRDPLVRAATLCELRGAKVDAERNTAMPPAFLQQQLAWREALDDARDVQAVRALDDGVAAQERSMLGELERLLDSDESDPAAAAAQVRALMFVARFREDIDRRLDALGQ